MAKTNLDTLQRGFDIDDDKLSSDQIKNKYQGKVLEEKSRNFAKLPIEDQKEILYSAISGDKTNVVKDMEDASSHSLMIQRVLFFFRSLKKIGKDGEWIERSCPYKTFLVLPLEEKDKYHNAMVSFHDECMKKAGHSGDTRILDSSPAGDDLSDAPNFSDESKWSKK